MGPPQQLRVDERAGGVRFEVRVQPRASREGIVGVHDGALKVALTAPPVEGKANEGLVRLLGKALGVPRRQIRITSGERSRHKAVEVTGVEASTVRQRLAGM